MIGRKRVTTSINKFGSINHLENLIKRFREPYNQYKVSCKDAEVLTFLLEREVIRRRVILSQLNVLRKLNLDEDFINEILK